MSEVPNINININNNTLIQAAPSEARIMALILALSLSISSLDSVRKTVKAAAVAVPAQLIEHNTHSLRTREIRRTVWSLSEALVFETETAGLETREAWDL